MSKFFYKGRIETREQTKGFGYNTKRAAKLGTVDSPLALVVNSPKRKVEIEAILEEQALVADIELNSEAQENIIELETMLNKPKTTTFEKTPNRNDPCLCGSGKKYKKCCAK